MDSFFGLTRKTFTHPQLHEMGEAVALYMSKEVASNPTSNQDKESKEIPEMTQTLMQMVKEYKDTSGQKSSVELSRKLVWEEYEEWEYEVNCPEGATTDVNYAEGVLSGLVVSGLEYSAKDELKELADLVYVLGGYALAKGWDLDEALKRVHANNVGRMFQPDGSILRRDDGKILKHKGYAKVDLEDLV
jgi:hypothetical protein